MRKTASIEGILFGANVCTLAPMMLAGIRVADKDVLELARLLREVKFDEVAARLEGAWDAETKVVALTIEDRERILRALDDPPAGLAELERVSLLPIRARSRRVAGT